MCADWENADLSDNIFQAAMYLCDELGLKEFRKCRGGTFTQADGQHVYYEKRGPYEARPLIAVAYSLRYPNKEPLQPKDFKGMDAHHYLKNKGFSLQPI